MKFRPNRSQSTRREKKFSGRTATFEPVEPRQLMSVSLNPAGWSVVTPSASARVIYVSSSRGSDHNSGTSASAPVQSLAAAAAMLRNNSDDEMLLRRGDTWAGSFPQWTKSGISPDQPMLIGTYGTGARPVIDTGTAGGLVANTKHPVNFLTIDGLVFDAGARDSSRGTVTAAAASAAPVGLQILGPSTGLVVEDSSFSYFKDDVVLQAVMGPVTNVTIRRTTIDHSYCTSAKSQGLYADGVSGLTLDQDVFDHDGWNENVSGAGMTGYNHDIYCYANVTGLSVTNSVIARASYMGVMARGGGVIDDNLFLDNGYAVSFGDANGALSTPGGVSGRIDGNVVLGDHGLPGSLAGGGFEIGNTAAAAHVTVSDNVFAGDTQNNFAAISLSYANATKNPGDCVGLNNLTIDGNVVYGWHSGISLGNFVDGGSGVASLNGLVVKDNQFQDTLYNLVSHANSVKPGAESWSGNTYYAASSQSYRWFSMTGADIAGGQWQQSVDKTGTDSQLSYVDPTRTVESLSKLLGGGGTEAAVMATIDSQSDGHWVPGLAANSIDQYVRAGFATAPGTIQPTTVVAPTKLVGTTIGTAGSFENAGNDISKATDGRSASFFDGTAANGNWVGLDLGSAKSVGQITFTPRQGFAGRMVGGSFQVSDSTSFGTGTTTVFTITTAPSAGGATTVTLSSAVTGRYVRYVSPDGSYGNVAEIAFYG